MRMGAWVGCDSVLHNFEKNSLELWDYTNQQTPSTCIHLIERLYGGG